MKEIIVDKKWIEDSTLKSKEMGNLNNSITKGDGNLSGFIGEMMTLSFLPESKLFNTYDFDIIYKDNVKADVKTKRTKVKPKPFYECSIANYNTHQLCDEYVFVRVLNDMSKGWILGWMDKDEYLNRATFMVKGEIDPSNNFRVRADCYNLPISELRSF